MTTAAELFVDWAWNLRTVPAEVRHAVGRHLLDGLGCAAAAARRQPDHPAVTVARRYAAPAEATVIGTGLRTSAPYAAFANGALVHALDYDDTHADALVHATATVLPALCALGERTGASADDLLAAAAAGYETVLRLGAAVPHGFHARGLHATAVCGVFAAALVSARLLGLSQEQAVHALGIAGSSAAGSLEFLDTGAATKSLHPGLAALAGITAAELAAAGATGPASIFEGRHGLFASYLGATVGPEALTAGLGRTWEVTRISIKPYAACQLSHASLDALTGLLPELGPADCITRITCDLPAGSIPIVAEPRPTKVAPRTSYEAKFSLPWCAAALVLDGALTVGTFDEPERPDARALAARIEVEGTAHDGPPATAPGRVVVERTDGTRLVGEAAPSRVLTDDEVRAKFVANVGHDPADVALRVLSWQDIDDLTGLLARLTPSEEAAA